MSMLPQLRTRAPHLRAPRRPLAVGPAEASDHVVDCAIYADGRRRPGSCTPADIAAMRRAGDGFVWLGLHDPDEAELAALAERFDLHPLAVEDAVRRAPAAQAGPLRGHPLHRASRPSATSSTLPRRPPSRGGGERGDLRFIGRDFVITVRRGGQGGLRGLRRTAGAGPGAAGVRAVRGAARDRGPDRGRLPGRGGEHAARHRRGRDRGLRRTRPVRAGTPSGSTAQARGARAASRAVTPLAAPLRTLSERPMRLVTRRSASTSGTSRTTWPG